MSDKFPTLEDIERQTRELMQRAEQHPGPKLNLSQWVSTRMNMAALDGLDSCVESEPHPLDRRP